MKNNRWTTANIGNLQGKNIIITGASSGLGLEATQVLSSKGAHVIMAVRNMSKGANALKAIKRTNSKAKLTLMELDLADLNSIRKFATDFQADFNSLDLLLNNAGVMFPKQREETKQGFETHFGTNHLGHFALTGLLLNTLKKTPKSRVITQSSLMHKVKADIHFDDLNCRNSYDRITAYSQSKLANLLFAYELDRRLKASQSDSISIGVHPGYTVTNLQSNSGLMVGLLTNLVAQKVEMGTLPILRGATDLTLKGGEYVGPTNFMETRGYPQILKSSPKSYDMALAQRLWEVSEELTQVKYTF